MQILELLLRIGITFFTLLILTRIMGRKEISQMTFFNFVSGIALGTLGASLAIDSSLTIRNGLIALVAWSAITVIMGIIDIKSRNLRELIVGQPIILIRQGKIVKDALRKARLDFNALRALLRQKNVFSISDVDYAIFETSGKLSVMKKETLQTPTKRDIGVQQTKTTIYPIPTEVISDGKVINSNLMKLNLETKWLNEQLQSVGVNSISDVFYAEVQKDGTLFVDKRTD